jgi:hypothetical protein
MSGLPSSANGWAAIRREAAFLARDRSVLAWWLVVLCLSVLAVSAGWAEVRQQNTIIARLVEADRADRTAVLKTQSDWGGAAYYSFHLTYDAPSDFAFAALGRRDDAAWKHRVRMLALEGQIHERDAGHPVLALIGRFDFAFLAAFVLPLVLIVLLHDLRARERVAGRHDLLVATAGRADRLWQVRAALRAGGVFICAAIPLLVVGVMANAAGMDNLVHTTGGLAAVRRSDPRHADDNMDFRRRDHPRSRPHGDRPRGTRAVGCGHHYDPARGGERRLGPAQGCDDGRVRRTPSAMGCLRRRRAPV